MDSFGLCSIFLILSVNDTFSGRVGNYLIEED
nr:MAG TPA: hypothetical protein [Caudoviricetes sp.]